MYENSSVFETLAIVMFSRWIDIFDGGLMILSKNKYVNQALEKLCHQLYIFSRLFFENSYCHIWLDLI